MSSVYPLARPRGQCGGAPNPDPRCWACTFTGSFNGGQSGRALWETSLRERRYEELVELAQQYPSFSISGLWYALPNHAPSDFSLAKNVVWDLWFHRLSRPLQVSTNGVVRSWRWAHVLREEALDNVLLRPPTRRWRY